MAAVDFGYTCFIWGLARDTDREALQKAFASFGDIIDSKVINNRGFVTFSSEQAMRDAVEGMNGRDLDGCNITVYCSDVRHFHLGGLIGRLVHCSGSGRFALGLGLRFGCRGFALGIGLGFNHGRPSVALRARPIRCCCKKESAPALSAPLLGDY
ncbi:hypothetical protein QN277_004964 [Acacia crassicarpa]|uniref:RRM domain-containing protein n=1 Tax=Acacia crassicarpa TaxID=499986 RepID=A0AAE1IVH0_9FABA|nr:hypothetical protein QN277_004964 [Acacia crassicarpa]